jgi:hypothetical protein
MHAVNVIWLLSCHARAWVGITQSLPDIDRQFSLCFPLMQTLIEAIEDAEPATPRTVADGDSPQRSLGNDAALSLLTSAHQKH